MATLVPGYTLTTAAQRWTSQVLGLTVRLAAAPLTGTLDADLPATASLTVEVGDPVTLDLDGGEGGARVFTGTVTALRRTLVGVGVHAVDAAGLLARLRPATSYEQVSAGTVIRDLADQCGVETGRVDDGAALAWYPADPGRTALDHVARLSSWSGALARVDADGRLTVTAVAATQADFALRHGRELMAAEQTGRLRDVDSFTVAGESGAGSTSSPDALRPTSDFFAGNRPDGPDATHRWSFEPALRTTDAAAAAGAAARWRYAAGADVGHITAFLQPRLRPGTVIEIADLPDPLSTAPVWLDRVRHRIGPDEAVTTARMFAGGPPAGNLLGSLTGAAAGALGL